MKRLILSIIFTLLASPCLAEVLITEEVTYFTVTGKTKSEISQSLRKNSPIKKKKSYAAATTKSQLSYEVSTRKNSGRCDVVKTTVKLHLTYTYPRLAQTPDRRTHTWWMSQLELYEKHELTHGDIAREYAKRLERKLSGMTNLNCGTIKNELERRFNYYNRKMSSAQAEFDRKEQEKF